MADPHRVCVVGGGVAGLAAALEVQRRLPGARVTLVEAAGRLGGKVLTAPLAGVAFDDGAEAFLTREADGVRFVSALGLGADLVSPATNRASVWARGRLRPLPGGTLLGVPARLGPLARSGVLSAAGLARVAVEPLRPAATPAATAPAEDVAVGAFLAARLGPEAVASLVDPLLGGVYAGRADELSLHATMPALADELAHAPSVVRAARRVLAAAAPARFVTVTGGLGRVVDAAAAAIRGGGGDIVLGRPVRRLSPTPTGWRVTHGPTTDERHLDVGGVILAVPAAPAARLLADPVPAAGADLARIPAASVAVVSLAFAGAGAGPGPRLGSGYLVPAAAHRPVKAVTFSSRKWAHLADSGHTLARCSVGRHGDVTELQFDDAELVDAARAELAATAALREPPIASRVTRWGGALPQYTVGHLDRVARILAAVGATRGLAVAGATYDGVGVPACIRSGEAAAAKLAADLGQSQP